MNKRQHDFADDRRIGSKGNSVNCNQKNMHLVNEMARNAYFEEANTIGVEDIFFRILDHIKFIFISALLCAILSVAYALFFVSPKYEATAKLYVSGGIDSVTTYGVIQANTALAVDYLEAFDTWEVREMVLENLELDCSHEQLQDMVTIDIPDDTRMMHITVKHADAQLTADIANAYAAAGIAFAGDVMKVAAPDLISRAVVPVKSITHGKLFYAVMGFAVGLVLVTCVTAIVIIFDDKPRNPEEILGITGIPVIAVIPAKKKRSALNGSANWLRKKAV